jgi:hypothetical protein
MILAKPVVPDQYWILKEDDRKVGNVQANEHGVTVKIKDRTIRYTTAKIASNEANIEFENPITAPNQPTSLVHGYEVKGEIYNPVWDVKQKLPLFTREDKSKSWYAAGWYLVRQHRNWKAVQHPKLITLQRYPYQGPYHTKEEANEHKS